MRLQEACLSPVLPPHIRFHITIWHPGYIYGEDIMFALPRLDDVGPEDQTDKARLAQASDDEQDTCYGEQASYGEKDSYGVHFGTMLLACQVIAGNSFNTAYLSHDRKGSHRVQLPPGGILMHDRYFLHVPRGADEADTTSYAVTPNFQQWRFPGAGALPAPWRSIAMTPRDAATSCILSGRMRPEKAHVIPQSHDRWYTDNGMSRYSQGAHSVSNSDDNTFRLRADLHRIFDDRAFTLVPKLDAEGQQHTVVHFFSTTSSGDAALVYHNRKVHSIQFVAPEFLFARFALTVFACIKDFILSGERRRIAVVHRGINSSGNPAWVTREIEMDRAQRHSQYGGGGSRSSSPSKRSRSEAQQEAERFELVEPGEYDDMSRIRAWVEETEADHDTEPSKRRQIDRDDNFPLPTYASGGPVDIGPGTMSGFESCPP